MRARTEPFLRRTTVLLPALDEAECIGPTIAAWQTLGAARLRVVDNGSRDGTAAIARAAGADVLTEAQRGYGAAAWCGLQSWPEDTEWVLFSSADGSDRLTADEVACWQRAVDDGADLILGDRTASAASRRELKFAQRFGNAVACAAIGRGWGRRFRDMASLRLVRRHALVTLPMTDRAFGWNVEMQVKGIEQGWNIVELPVTFRPRMAGQSKISGSWRGTVRAGSGIIMTLLQLWQYRRSQQWRPAVPVVRPSI